MPILGYGEDPLTLNALMKGLPGIFHQLADDSDPGKALVFYRPSSANVTPSVGRRVRFMLLRRNGPRPGRLRAQT
jgi:hypothetical protein